MKVSELTGAMLDYWVGQAEGKESYIYAGYCFLPNPHREPGDADGNFQPSINWKQAGPIIDRERIDLDFQDDYVNATIFRELGKGYIEMAGNEVGQTALIAAMRAFVASKYGKEVPEHCTQALR